MEEGVQKEGRLRLLPRTFLRAGREEQGRRRWLTARRLQLAALLLPTYQAFTHTHVH